MHWRISPDLKQRVLQLTDEGISPRAVTDVLGMSVKSIKHWHTNYELHGSITPQKTLPRCPRLLTTEELCQLIEDDPILYLDELCDWLAIYHDVQISISQLHETLWQVDITQKAHVSSS